MKLGFTLTEVMAATVVLSLGMVLIYEAFFISLDAFDYYINYLNVSPWMNEKVWETQDNLKRLGSSAQVVIEGSLVRKNKKFDWELSYGLINENETQQLYKIDLVLWQEKSGDKIKFLRNAYALYDEEKEE